MAWGLEGHRVTGEIADRHLTKKARNAIAKILGDQTIAIASNWADFIKSDSTYNYINQWHYIDIEDSLSFHSIENLLLADTAADAYTKINFLSAELRKNELPRATQAMYLKLLIHIVEDVHQPLHTADREQGGNGIKVLWMNEPSNLHRLWDADLIQFQQLSYTEYTNAIDHATKAQVKEWQQQPLSQWLYDSYVLNQRLFEEITQPNQRLSYRYNYDHIATLNLQMLKAGIHLAKMLNDIYG